MQYCITSSHQSYRSEVPRGPQPVGERSRRASIVLRERLADHPVRQEAIAAHAGMSQSQLSRCLTGVRPWNLDQLDAVCAYLGTNLVDVIAATD